MSGLFFCIMLHTEIHNRIGIIKLARPDKRNAFNAELVNLIKHAFDSYNEDQGIRAILITAEGSAFSAGADLAYIQSLRSNSLEENEQDSMALADMFETIYNSPKLTISAVQGAALAGGCGLATVTDLCFASEQATFGYTEARIGFVPAIVMAYLLKKTSIQLARELMLTAKIIDAKRAYEVGLVTEVLPPEDFEDLVISQVQKLIHSTSGQSIALTKEMLRTIPAMQHKEALKYAAQLNAKARSSEDCMRGMDAFLNKEKLDW